MIEKELVGFYAFNAVNKTTIKLFFFFVEPKYIGKGFGKKLILDFIQRAKDMGYQRVIVDADPNAEIFYSKIGFKTIGQLQSSIKDRFLPLMEFSLIRDS